MPCPTWGGAGPPRRAGRKSGPALALGLTLVLLAGPGQAQTRTAQRTLGGAPPGATLESVLAVARLMLMRINRRAGA